MSRKPILLCVDDERMVLDSLAEQLERMFGSRCDIEIAESAEEALELLDELEHPHQLPLVLSDQIMPGMRGDQFLIELYQRLPDTLAILLTGQADLHDLTTILNQARLYRYIAKPWDKEDLSLTVSEALKTFEQARTIERQHAELREQHEALQQLFASVEAQVQERTQELADALQQLEGQHRKLQETQSHLVQSEKMASVGMLVSGIAHELNNPANFIHGGAQNLQRQLTAWRELWRELTVDEEAEVQDLFDNHHYAPMSRSIGSILEGSSRTQHLVRHLMVFASFGKSDERVERSLHTSLESTLTVLQTRFRGVLMEYLPRETPALTHFPAQLNQAFMCILVNACQAIEDRRALDPQWAGGAVHVEDEAREDALVLRFRDDGVGIPGEVLPRVFEPFFTTRPVGEGVGLGLSIAYHIVEQHGGRLSIESMPKLGTIVTLELPLSPPDPTAPG